MASSLSGVLSSGDCELTTNKVVGAASLATGVSTMALGAIAGSGVFGGGDMYYVAGGLVVGSVISFFVAAHQLSSCCKKDDSSDYLLAAMKTQQELRDP